MSVPLQPFDADIAPSFLKGTRVETRVRGPLADPEAAWALLGDTDWLNRVGGNGALLSMDMQSQRDGLPVVSGVLAGPAGLTFPFEEAWTSWSRGHWFRQLRTIESPLLWGTDYLARLQPEGDGVRPEARLALHVPAWAAWAGRLALTRMRRRWEEVFATLGGQAPDIREVPPAARAALERWSPTDPEVVDRFSRWIRRARPTTLGRIRAFALADDWGMDRDRVLDALVAGVSMGAVELFWSVRCARCYGQVAAATALSDLPDHASCPACKVDSGVDLGESVEVLFAPHPSLVPRSEERFCTMYPLAAPEQYAIYTLGPHQSLEDEVEISSGEWRLGAAGNASDQHLRATPGGPLEVSWRADAGRPFAVDEPEATVGTGPLKIKLHNDRDVRVRVYLTRVGGAEPVVPAALLTTRPAFRRAFSHEVLSADLRVSVRAVTVLFTDLSGSTAMYEEVGDARAFAIVRDHFTLLRGCIERSGGVVVKTIGDAVMAAFHEPERALDAALAMQAEFPAYAQNLGLARPLTLKIGLHSGAALAVHGDQGLDWFGGTVNLAARTQGAARGGEIVLSDALWGLDAIRTRVTAAGLQPEPLEAELKGIAGVTRLWRLAGEGGRGEAPPYRRRESTET